MATSAQSTWASGRTPLFSASRVRRGRSCSALEYENECSHNHKFNFPLTLLRRTLDAARGTRTGAATRESDETSRQQCAASVARIPEEGRWGVNGTAG